MQCLRQNKKGSNDRQERQVLFLTQKVSEGDIPKLYACVCVLSTTQDTEHFGKSF